MSLPTAYTPLESLLLFQALRAEGVNSHAVFNRISEQLQGISIVRNDPSFDRGRLSPDALRELYLWLLKEEAKRDVGQQNVLQNGDVSPGSRKRKAPSPSLPTVQEASKHTHLIPQLVTRLYARYRDHTVGDIREHEKKYDSLNREIASIEAGEWDEKLQRQRQVSRNQSPLPSSSSHTQANLSKLDKSKTASPKSPLTTVESNVAASAKPYKGNKIGDVMNHGPEPQHDSGHHRRNSSNTTLPPLSEMAPQSPHFGMAPNIPGPISTNFHQSPTNTMHSPYGSHHAHPPPGSVASPGVQHSLSRPSSSPRPILPPPPGMKLPTPSPVQGAPHYPSQPPPPHRMSTGYSPTNDRPQGFPPQIPAQIPGQASGYYQQQPPYPDRRTSYPITAHQQVQANYPAQPGGYQLTPFTLDQQDGMHARTPQQYAQQPPQAPAHHQALQGQRTPHTQQVPSAPPTSSRLVPPHNAQMMSNIIAALATPPRGAGGLKRPPRLQQPGTPLPSPAAEPLSPVLKRSEPAARSTRSTRNRDGANSEPSAEPESAPRTTRARGRTKRERSPLSTVSSTADESARMTRSQSVSTAAGAIPTSDDRPGSRARVKAEPSTPAAFLDAPDVAHELPSASGGPMTRKRRGTLQSHPQPAPKRSRRHSPAPESEAFDTPPPRPTTVLATRHFHKISTPIMDSIMSHKFASYFAGPPKGIPGYGDIVKQPQNLKSIRSAITAGNKAVNAAVSALEAEQAGTPTAALRAGDGSTVELERTEEIVPPKGIVNSAQLEKEVMRMFANAVMFNPGDDGLVRDTREMAEEVQGMLAQWRGAEKEAGDGDAEVGEEGKGKRRKV